MPGREMVRRVGALETATGPSRCGSVVLMVKGGDKQAALAAHEARFGKKDGEPLFVCLVGIKPGEAVGVQ